MKENKSVRADSRDAGSVIGVIPARYGSTRFEGKVLASIGGKPLIQHVYENAKRAKSLSRLLVATEDKRVMDACARFGAEVQMTSAEHASGTDRIAEVARNVQGDIFVNIQGDEPMVHPDMIDALVEPFRKDKELRVSTLITKVDSKEELESPNVVKVVIDTNGIALYFSRSIIPFQRDEQTAAGKKELSIYYRHLGLYAYRRDFLLAFTAMEPSTLEQVEKLEQLRILENGYRIKAVETPYRTIAVDTVEDLERVRRIMEEKKQKGAAAKANVALRQR